MCNTKTFQQEPRIELSFKCNTVGLRREEKAKVNTSFKTQFKRMVIPKSIRYIQFILIYEVPLIISATDTDSNHPIF